MQDENYGFLKTHYYFDDNSHSMDAFVKNKCDKALLSIIDEAGKELRILKGLKVDVLALREGSLIEWHQFIVSPTGVFSILTLFVNTLACILVIKPPSLPESDLDIKNKKLDIEKKELEINLLHKELADAKEKSLASEKETKEDDLALVKELIEEMQDVVYDVLINNHKIRKNLSVFYENLIEYHKVEAMGFSTYNFNQQVVLSEVKVERSDFEDFVLDLNEYEETDENAKILIFSPNLVKGRHKWRGFYEKENKVIEFSMNDKDFKSDVESGAILFKNGSMIRAVLNIKIKLDISGNESSRSYVVNLVISKSDGQGYTETRQGRNYKNTKKDEKAQLSILFDN